MLTEKTINGLHKPELLDLIKSAISDINTINNSIETADGYKSSLQHIDKMVSGEDGLFPNIVQADKEIFEKLNKIKEVYIEIVGDEEDEENVSIKAELEKLKDVFQKHNIQIEQFKTKIFGSVKKNEAGEVITETKGLSKEIDEFFLNGKKEYERLMADINNRLSPGATSVELAETFKEKVEEYKKSSEGWIKGFIAIIVPASIYYAIVLFVNTQAIKIEDVWIQLLYRAPFFALVFWLAMFISNRRAENKKLEETYKHKEVMARSYTGYRKSIENLDKNDTELLKMHMKNLLETINNDPGKFLNSTGEQHPFIGAISNMFGKGSDKQGNNSSN